MVLVEQELGRVLDRDDALGVGDRLAQGRQERRLAGARAARDEHVLALADDEVHEAHHVGREHAQAQEVIAAQPLAAEAPDRDRRAVEGDGRDGRVDAAAVGQAQVDHRAAHVDAAADARGQALDHALDVLLVAEAHVGPLEAAVALDVDPRGAVDQDVRHGWIGHQGRQGTDAQGLLDQLVAKALALLLVEGQLLGLERARDEVVHGLLDLLLVAAQEVALADVVQQPLVQARLDREVVHDPAAGLGVAPAVGALRARGLRAQAARGRGRDGGTKAPPRDLHLLLALGLALGQLLLGADLLAQPFTHLTFAHGAFDFLGTVVGILGHAMASPASGRSPSGLDEPRGSTAVLVAAPSISRIKPCRALPKPKRRLQVRA